MLTVTSHVETETISEAHDIATAERELEQDLASTATDDYAGKVLKWFKTDPSQPFEIANGNVIETWKWTGDPR